MNYRVEVSMRILGWTLATSLLLLGAVSPVQAQTSADAAVDPLAPFTNQQVNWQPCAASTFCARVTVPLNYADPAGPTIELSVRTTVASGEQAPNSGAEFLFINPGGPGASATDFVTYFASLVSPEVRAKFNIIGVDPRGVGDSTPVECMTGAQTSTWLRTNPTPQTPAEQRRFMSAAARIAPGCLRLSPAIAPHVGTEQAVRDFDVIRAALGQQKMNWFGYSYGTQLGTAYAELYPDNVGLMVLDGAVDPALNAMEISRDQSRGFQSALRRYARDCADRKCALGRTPGSVLGGINQLLRNLDKRPLPVNAGPKLVRAEAITAVFFGMYSPDLWNPLTQALIQARRGDGTALAQLAAAATDRIGPNTYASNLNSAFLAINCWDLPATPDQQGLADSARAWSKGAAVPALAQAMSWLNAPCSTWFGHSELAPAPAQSDTQAQILIVGTRFDPATPYAWAEALHDSLPTSALLTFEGDGHTAYGAGSTCIDAQVERYLVNAVLPSKGSVCPNPRG